MYANSINSWQCIARYMKENFNQNAKWNADTDANVDPVMNLCLYIFKVHLHLFVVKLDIKS